MVSPTPVSDLRPGRLYRRHSSVPTSPGLGTTIVVRVWSHATDKDNAK